MEERNHPKPAYSYGWMDTQSDRPDSPNTYVCTLYVYYEGEYGQEKLYYMRAAVGNF